MDIKTSPRHSRQGFIQRMSPESLVSSLAKTKALSQTEIIDFSPPAPRARFKRPVKLIRHISTRARTLSLQNPLAERELSAQKPVIESKKQNDDETKFLAKLAAAITETQPPNQSSSAVFNFAPKVESSKTGKIAGQLASHRMSVHSERLAVGRRIETFDNGSICNKDALGRVIEVSSSTGESLYLNYDDSGELFSFTRTDARGKIHSSGKKGSKGVTVRDSDGRVKALGECMTIDPWGRFYLHTSDSQYFCLDLVAGIHCERRRLVNSEANISFVTAAFAHDGFRMATVFARTRADYATRREMIYRFYGRDGSLVEFQSENEFRDLNASRSMPPGSLKVHESWLRYRQAHTAWDSVLEYLSRVS